MSSTSLPSYATKLHSKRVLVFGGSSGIGFGVACAAYEHGAQVIISSSSPDKINRAIERIQKGYSSAPQSASISGFACDLSNIDKLEDNLTSLLDQATESGPLDHIAITAGDSLSVTPIAEITTDQIVKAGTVRFYSLLILSKLIAKRNAEGSPSPYLSSSPDSSLTATSGSNSEKTVASGWVVPAGFGSAIEGASRALAKDLKPIRVNVVQPGAIETEMFASIPAERKESVMDGFRKETATGRVGRPEDIAEAYLYFMRDGFCTGKVLGSDGGRLLM